MQRIHGNIRQEGYRLGLIRGHSHRPVRLDISFIPQTLVLVVCLMGESEIQVGGEMHTLQPEHYAVFCPHQDLRWYAKGGQRLLLLEVNWESLGAISGGEPLRSGWTLAALMSGQALLHVDVGSLGLITLAQQLAHPPAHAVCLPIWHRAKTLELMAFALFEPAHTEKQAETAASVNQGRVERAAFLLEKDLENPPTLEMLASEVGCGTFQLSRLFTKVKGVSIPEFLRKHRMNRAALLLRNSQQSVSDIALSVGYTSFSAFTRGFVREHKVTPSQYRADAILGND